MNFNLPILIILFNRSDNTKELFKILKQLRPTKLYVNIDGPRVNNNKDLTEVEACKNLVQNIDWPCEVYKQYHKNNLGCKNSVVSAIDWVFEFEEHTIILEDDCIPSLSFFEFCERTLIKYKNEYSVMQISGNNFIENYNDNVCYFSTINDIWGWATWKRAWEKYKIKMDDLDYFLNQNLLTDYTSSKKISNWLKFYLLDANHDDSTTWSSQWSYAIIKSRGLTIVPPKNLVKNIGFIGESTHGQSKSWNLYTQFDAQEITEYHYPDFIYPNRDNDKNRFKLIEKTDPNLSLANKLKRSKSMISLLKFILPNNIFQNLKKLF
jgi:hypothetical protein